MKSPTFSILLGLVAIGTIAINGAAVLAVKVEDVPNPRQSQGWVTDMAEILNPETEAQINTLVERREQEDGTELVVVTVPDTIPYGSPKEFTTELFNYWGVGKAGVDNGIVFMVSKGDRRVEIETGYGVEEMLPDAKIGNIINQQVTPHFKQGNFDEGVLAGTKALLVEADTDAAPDLDSPQGNAVSNWLQGLLGWSVGIGIFSVYLLSFRRRYIAPNERTCIKNAIFMRRPVYCQVCKQPMARGGQDSLNTALSKADLFRQSKEYAFFEGWKCQHCQPSQVGLQFSVLCYPSASVSHGSSTSGSSSSFGGSGSSFGGGSSGGGGAGGDW